MATRYVRQGASSGANNGTDWTNAYTTLSGATLSRGDVIYIATGTYAGRTINTAVAGTTLITIKKATVADHGISTGWSDAFGTGTATFTSQLAFSTSNILFDGQTGGGPNNWYGPFGFKVQVTAVTGAVVLGAVNNFGLPVSGLDIRHIEIQGNLDATGGGSDAQDGIEAGWSRVSANLSYYYIHDMGRTVFWLNVGTLFVAEYGVTGRYNATGAQHSEVVSLVGSVTGQFIFRYNLVTSVGPYPTTGGVMLDTQDGGSCHVYGNVFWRDPALNAWESTNGSVITGWCGQGCPSGGNGSGEMFNNIFVYNNTFAVISSSSNPTDMLSSTPVGTHNNTNARNNLFYSIWSAGGGSNWTVNSHGHFISTTAIGTNSTTGSGDPFVSLATQNFRLTASTPAGFDVGAGPAGNTYNIDMFGTTRTTWTRGAVEFSVAGGDITPPTAPSTLAATTISTSQINLSWTASTDNIAVTNYLIERALGSGAFAQIGTSLVTSFSNTGLTESATYRYQVRATDAAGNFSAYSNIVTQATLTIAPAAPTGVTIL